MAKDTATTKTTTTSLVRILCAKHARYCTMALRYAGARAAARRRNTATARSDMRDKMRADPHAFNPRPRPSSSSSASSTSHRRADEKPGDYLARLGCEKQFRISLGISGHTEEEGHTMYEISCSLHPAHESVSSTAWTCRKRLCHIREGLHDPVKEVLAEAYSDNFGDTPFARHGGLPGTTARLGAWLAVLGCCMSKGVIPETCCAEVLRFLDAPVPVPDRSPNKSDNSPSPKSWATPPPSPPFTPPQRSKSPGKSKGDNGLRTSDVTNAGEVTVEDITDEV
eukprot:TRINITY_DN4626_c1_g6_i1.p1 TRINITY_DN4626_c1_g6~~TRINITY_DN4626_c1_g6_i1.p1  ORF type:complete len:282 (+),score=51.49 TRINITY_DN4626_c1_g6_i1:25-870(+)